MLSLNMIKHRINDLEHTLVPQDINYTLPHRGRIDSLYWVIQGNQIKSEKEIRNKIQRHKEELLCLNSDLSKGSILYYNEKVARIAELEKLLEDLTSVESTSFYN